MMIHSGPVWVRFFLCREEANRRLCGLNDHVHCQFVDARLALYDFKRASTVGRNHQKLLHYLSHKAV